MSVSAPLAAIRAQHPLLHCISNIVSANDCANLALAIGASPIMAQAPQEMADIAALAGAVVLNTGTPDEAKFTAARTAGATANRRSIPVVLDPVGVGASPWRLANIQSLLQQVQPAIVRVNAGEAAALLGLGGSEHGVDSLTAPKAPAGLAAALAQKLGCVVLLSGTEDLIADGQQLCTVRGGSDRMRTVTGAGFCAGRLPPYSRGMPLPLPCRPHGSGKPAPSRLRTMPPGRAASAWRCLTRRAA